MNTWDVLDEEPEFLSGVGTLRAFLDQHGLEREARVAKEGDLRRVRSLRRRVGVFEANTEAEAVETLNDLLADSAAPAEPGKGRSRFVREPRRARNLADRLAPRVAAAALLRRRSRPRGWERFGVCDALPCRCVYLDQLPQPQPALLLPALRRPDSGGRLPRAGWASNGTIHLPPSKPCSPRCSVLVAR